MRQKGAAYAAEFTVVPLDAHIICHLSPLGGGEAARGPPSPQGARETPAATAAAAAALMAAGPSFAQAAAAGVAQAVH